MAKTTATHFKTFRTEAQRWRREFGLTAWDVGYFHIKSEGEDGGSLAGVARDASAYSASVVLNREWGDTPVTAHNLKKTAFHETCHILLARMVALANGRSTTGEQIDEAEHEIIGRLETAMFGEDG